MNHNTYIPILPKKNFFKKRRISRIKRLFSAIGDHGNSRKTLKVTYKQRRREQNHHHQSVFANIAKKANTPTPHVCATNKYTANFFFLFYENGLFMFFFVVLQYSLKLLKNQHKQKKSAKRKLQRKNHRKKPRSLILRTAVHFSDLVHFWQIKSTPWMCRMCWCKYNRFFFKKNLFICHIF